MAALLQEKTANKSRVLYRLSNRDLREFVKDPANNFLVTFFSQNSDYNSDDTSCKADALEILLHFGRSYE